MSHAYSITLLSLLLCAPSWAQKEDEVFSGPHIDKLIGEGQYEEAFEFIKAAIEKNLTLETYSATFYAGLAKFYMEMGRPKDAGDALKVADTVSSRTGYGNAFAAREMAAFQLMQGDYGSAASWAVKAIRESSYRKADQIVQAYWRSLEAVARLRSGDLKRAETLVREALRDVPKTGDATPFFAPRVLFAGCLIESHRANHDEAQDLCRRGLEIVQARKIESRDVSLAYLAMSESYLLSGDMVKSREFATKSMEYTAKTLRPEHQDRVGALMLLARVDLKESKPEEALTHAKAAVDMAAAIFGEGAGGMKGPKQILQEVTKAAK